MNIKICSQCNKEFSKGLHRSNPSWLTAKYCSSSCYRKSKVGKPTPMFGQVSPFKGKNHSEESKEKNRLAHIGITTWNKGLGKPRKYDARTTRKFKEFRVSILIKSSYKCSKYGVVNGRLEIDHLKPVKFFPELVLDESNVRVLCRECHKKTVTYGVKVFNYEHA